MMPNKKLTKKRHSSSKAICEECKKEHRVRNIVLFKGKYICPFCKRKYAPGGSSRFSIGKSLERIYNVRGYINKRTGKITSIISVPSILIGHKVKLVLVD